ncbi:hypothetical protein SAMN05444414_10861 [Roseovarius marisflavi]|uniref:Uncharacterized protein n=1 Tax=Roseovarius marisflavi TaxID=1054996 RepID=A0A1M6YXB6_9RHOB|nr:hypothetical protein [Roseovarius marisflavi]SHL22941.1 hypothetical protein SAMN05444414_10861 [Roseovarius marisflavi]
MIQKVDTFEYFRISNVKIEIDRLVSILDSTGETSITLECGDTIYESLEEIKFNKSAIVIPFRVECDGTTISFDPFEVSISGKSSSSHRQKALSKELEAYVPLLSKRPVITLLVGMFFIPFGLLWLFDYFDFESSTKFFGANLTDIAQVCLNLLSAVAVSMLYMFHWTRVKLYSSTNGFWGRHKEQIAVGVIVALVTAAFSYFVGL